MDPMTLLKQDHRKVKKLLTDLGETEEGTEREQLLSDVGRELRLHMKIEEQILYPIIPRTMDDPDALEEANTEHQLARDGLAKLEELVSAPGFGAAVEMLLGGISHHVEEEESEILPTMKSELSREQWMALGDQIADMKTRAGSPPQPAPAKKSATKRSAKPKSASTRSAKATKRPTKRSATAATRATKRTSRSG